MQVYDSAERYGSLSRSLHWGMVVLLLYQFMTAVVRVLAEDSALDQLLWSGHKPAGVLLMVLIVLRVLWALGNCHRRPPSVNGYARAGHIVLYGLMLVIPALALLRQYASGRAFEAFGLPLMPGFAGDKIEWLMAPGNWLHGELGWLLLVLIAGHVFMAIAHRRRSGDEDVLQRMWR